MASSWVPSAPSVPTLRNDKTLEYYDVLRKKTHLVARAGFSGDLEIQGDTTVSRSHAKIFLVKIAVGNKISIHLKLIDNKSKFGTFVNDGIETNEQIAGDHTISLKPGDRIRFGRMDSTWTVMKYPIIVCPSTLRMADKEILRKSVSVFGGQVTRDWSDQCTHLCMQTITVTEKVLICLASAKSIVRPKYFTDLSEALSLGSLTELPFCEDYQPVLAENLLNPNSVSMQVNNKRKTLFFGKTFICSTTEQLNRISKIIKAAGGKTINYSDGILTDNEILNSDKHIFMQQDQNNTGNRNETYQLILKQLETMNKRSIPENDIGLAIVYSNTAKYCNPDYNNSLVNFQSQESNINQTQASEILASETEMVTVVEDNAKFSINVIPDSHPETQNLFKRPFEMEEIIDSNEFELPQKRALLSNYQRESNNSEKINVEEDLEPFHRVNEPPTFSSRDRTFKPSKLLEPVVLSNIVDSCVTAVPDSQNVSNRNNHPAWLQANIINKNDNCNANNFHLKTVENGNITKRKISNVSSTISNNDEDPFDYMDIDEIEGHPKKKLKKEHSIFSHVVTTSTNKSKHQKTAKPSANEALDPNFITNLLSEAKGTGEIIDASKPSGDWSVNEHNDNKILANSVIIETVKLVVSKPTQSFDQGNNTHLQNFKKFKRKAPAMRIPHIVPLKLY